MHGDKEKLLKRRYYVRGLPKAMMMIEMASTFQIRARHGFHGVSIRTSAKGTVAIAAVIVVVAVVVVVAALVIFVAALLVVVAADTSVAAAPAAASAAVPDAAAAKPAVDADELA